MAAAVEKQKVTYRYMNSPYSITIQFSFFGSENLVANFYEFLYSSFPYSLLAFMIKY